MSERATAALQDTLTERRRRYTQEDREPDRERTSRAEGDGRQRRRRRAGSLDRMVQFNLDCDRERLDFDNWMYRWVNDDRGRPIALSTQDDYDFVTKADVGEAIESEDGSEGDGRVRRNVGYDNHGAPLYAYLMRKPRDFWDEDYEDIVRDARDQFMHRISTGEGAIDQVEHGYVPKGTKRAARISRAAA